MSADKFELLEAFILIAEKGSISKAARELNVEPSTISRKLKKLEALIKQPLIQRSSREFVLTVKGQQFQIEATDLINQWNSLEDRYRGAEQAMSGALKIIVPVGIGQRLMTEAAASFQLRYPDIRLTWILDDEAIKFTEAGCDLWIRLGEVHDPGLLCRKLAITQRTLVATPRFIAGKRVQNAACVEKLRCVSLDPIDGGKISLTSTKSHQTRFIYPEVVLSTNNFYAMYTAILSGLGFGVLPHWFVDEDIKAGRLVELSPDWQPQSLPINAAYLPGRYQRHRVGAFIGHLLSTLSHVPGITALSQKNSSI